LPIEKSDVIPAAFNSVAGQAGIHFDFAFASLLSVPRKSDQDQDQNGSQLSLG
jgi:hypothetical protein